MLLVIYIYTHIHNYQSNCIGSIFAERISNNQLTIFPLNFQNVLNRTELTVLSDANESTKWSAILAMMSFHSVEIDLKYKQLSIRRIFVFWLHYIFCAGERPWCLFLWRATCTRPSVLSFAARRGVGGTSRTLLLYEMWSRQVPRENANAPWLMISYYQSIFPRLAIRKRIDATVAHRSRYIARFVWSGALR